MEKERILKIKELRNSGFSYSKISETLGIPATTARYYANDEYRDGAKNRSQKYREKEPLQPKVNDYYAESSDDRDFTLKDVKEKFNGRWHCYLTGTPIEPSETDKYALDHIVPRSRGGKSNLENMGLLRRDVNEAKSSKTIDEFLQLCKEVLEYNGYEVRR